MAPLWRCAAVESNNSSGLVGLANIGFMVIDGVLFSDAQCGMELGYFPVRIDRRRSTGDLVCAL